MYISYIFKYYSKFRVIRNQRTNNIETVVYWRYIFYVVILFFSISVYSDSIPSLYVGEIISKDKESSNYIPKIRNQIVSSILKYHRYKYNVLDDELVKQLADKVSKMQKQGCTETECLRALDFAIDWDIKIVGEIKIEKDTCILSLRAYEMNRETFQPRVKNSLYESIPIYQLDDYVSEMSRALVDFNYTPKYSKASNLEGLDKKDFFDYKFEIDRPFWGNIIFPGYNRIYNKDSSGYILGSLWSLSLLGMVSTVPSYQSAKSSNSNWSDYAIALPFLLPQGSEFVGSSFALKQKNLYYKDANDDGQIINGLGILALGVWSYSWFYSPTQSQTGLWKMPNSNWEIDFLLSRKVEKGIGSMPENQYTISFIRSYE